MTRLSAIIGALVFIVLLSAADAHAQPTPQLHVSDAYSSCFFELHPELTQAQFEDFAGELGSILRFRPLGETMPLGKGNYDIGVQYTSTRIDDSKGAWNNTMSHPAADHYLGHAIVMPRIVARFGVADRVDVGLWGSVNTASNYGVVGFDTTVGLLKESDGYPVSLSIRPSISSLVGPKEVWVGNTSLDIAVSRTMGAFSPYVGVGTMASTAIARTDAVDLDPATATSSLSYAGVAYRWRALVLSTEVEKGTLFSYGFRIGTRF
jgi:hypothetical protein